MLITKIMHALACMFDVVSMWSNRSQYQLLCSFFAWKPKITSLSKFVLEPNNLTLWWCPMYALRSWVLSFANINRLIDYASYIYSLAKCLAIIAFWTQLRGEIELWRHHSPSSLLSLLLLCKMPLPVWYQRRLQVNSSPQHHSRCSLSGSVDWRVWVQ